MVTPTQHEEFKVRFATVLKDLQEHGHEDPETMWLLGSLAARIISTASKKGWPETKASLTSASYSALLKQFEKQGNDLHKKGNEKATYAVQALAISLVADKISDPEIKAGNEFLDEFINQTVRIYQANIEKTGKPN